MSRSAPAQATCLAVVWSRVEPQRVGELVIPTSVDDGTRDPATEMWLGRSPRRIGGLGLVRQRPGSIVRTGPPRSPNISREQWRVRLAGDALEIENIGRAPMIHDHAVAVCAHVRPGQLVGIAGELLFLAVRRPIELPAHRLPPALVPCFGAADDYGIVGESAAAWELRRQLAFAAGREDHVLLGGPSGSGKELAARAIHGLSRRAGERLIARNAATLPESLIDAELFGNPRDYPNPGMPERPGLIGAADGGTLFLDEIGELGHNLQAHLLRVVEGGEYQRLGEARSRRADVRVVAATNRDPLALKHDLLARLRMRVHLPGLDQRREDIPLLARHVLRQMAANDPLIAERSFPDGDCNSEPCWGSELMASLVTGSYSTHVRELQARLWQVLSSGDAGLTEPIAPRAPVAFTIAGASDRPLDVDPQLVTRDQVRAALEASGGSRERTWRMLGLRSRHQLVRLMRRFGMNGDAPTSPTFDDPLLE